MLFLFKNKSCLSIFLHTILLSSFLCIDSRAQSEDNSFEARMFRIYEKYYQKPILEDDWFKMVSSIEEQSYTVRPGDTLWGISEIYFGDGFYWSKLWSVNQNITNPHVIEVNDSILFSTGNFNEPPSIQVQTANSIPAALAGKMSFTGGSKTAPKYYSQLPDFFRESPRLNLGDESKISIIPRPQMVYRSDFFLTQEIFPQEIEELASVKSIGGDRMVSGESNRLILQTDDKTLSEGAKLSVVSEEMPYLSGGYGLRILAVVKVLRMIAPKLYEAEILRQFDGVYKGALVTSHFPLHVNMKTEGQPTEVDVKILSKDKLIWYTGDVVFLKSEKQTLSPGDLIKIHNKFDPKVDFYTQNGVLKVVSSRSPFATAVVIHTKTAMDQNSISSPKKSENNSWW
jgi:hypothetical protein